MTLYRIDFFKKENGITTEHIKSTFDDLQKAVNAASEGRRDGYKTYLLEHISDGYFNPLCELV